MTEEKQEQIKEYKHRIEVISSQENNYRNMFFHAALEIGFDLQFKDLPDNLKKRHPEQTIEVVSPNENDREKLLILQREFARKNSELFRKLMAVSLRFEQPGDFAELKTMLKIGLGALLSNLKEDPEFPKFSAD